MLIARLPSALAVAVIVVTLALAEDETTEVERRSVTARVVSAAGEGVGIHAKKVPGEFTVPEGRTAGNLKYRFHDPKSNFTSDKLTRSSIYSVTEKRYIREAENNPKLELPPGKYRFVVGGGPGAYGSLSFQLVAGEVADKPTEKPNVICTNVESIDKDGKRTPDDGFSKDNPLALVYRNGKLTGTHVRTQSHSNPDGESRWTTTIDATVKGRSLSGTYTTFYTHTDLQDKTIKDGFLCQKMWLTGKISGTLDSNGKGSATVSDWSAKFMERPAHWTWHTNGTVTLSNPQPWRERPPMDCSGYTIQFDLQLPTDK